MSSCNARYSTYENYNSGGLYGGGGDIGGLREGFAQPIAKGNLRTNSMANNMRIVREGFLPPHPSQFGPDNLLKLVSSQFNDAGQMTNSRTPYTFVMIQSAGCGHCKNAKPAFIQLSQMTNGNPKLTIATIQSDADRDLYTKLLRAHNIRGVPTYLLFKDGRKIAEYQGNRSLQDMQAFLQKNVK